MSFSSVIIHNAQNAIGLSKLRMLETEEKRSVQKLIAVTGLQLLENLTDKQLHNIHIPASIYLHAKRMFKKQNFKMSNKLVKIIPKTSFVYPEVLLIKGSNYFHLKKLDQAILEFNSCINHVEVQQEAYEDTKRKLYYRTLKDICIINIARTYFEKKDYTKSVKYYEMIRKSSFKWPYILLEKAWIYHQEDNFNRSLGLLITYNSPMLQSHFIPEAEVLKTLNYMNLCLYDDALFVINRYFSYYQKRTNNLDILLNKSNGKKNYFYNLLNSKETENVSEVKDLIRKHKRNLNYLFDKFSIKQIQKLQHGEVYFSNIIKAKIDAFVKNEIIEEINTFNKLSFDMFKLKIDIIQKKKSFIYQRKSLISNRARGSFKNVKRTYAQHFWKFRNEFWVDELGDYSLGLKSNCKTKKVI